MIDVTSFVKIVCLFFSVMVEAVDCGAPQDFSAVNVSYSSTTLNSTATYSCPNGSVLIGVETIVCQEDGQWSDDDLIPQCKPRQ